MDKHLRNAIGTAAQNLRKTLEDEYIEQLEGVFDVHWDGKIAEAPGAHLSPSERIARSKIVGALQYHRSSGLDPTEAVARFVRDAAFTTLNRFVALKMLEARDLLQQCVSEGIDSAGYREFVGLAPGVASLPARTGYRLYLESLFDELSTEVKVLFDRRDAASLLWPRHGAFERVLAELNRIELATAWADDETIGWFYQFFNSKEERQTMRDESSAPRNSRELAVRNQFFTPRYVVQFLVDNTLGRTWVETFAGTKLRAACGYLIELGDERPRREPKDPRDIRVLDPACGSGHFLLYSFDLLEQMYCEAWEQSLVDRTAGSLRDTYTTMEALKRAVPTLIIENNLQGVDVDPRAAQIAALALWLRAQRAWREAGIEAAERPAISRTGVIIAEPMPGDANMLSEFADSLDPPLLQTLFREIVASMSLAADMGTLLRVEVKVADAISRARAEFVNQRMSPQMLPGFDIQNEQGELDLSGIDDDQFFVVAEQRLIDALHEYAARSTGGQGARRRLFADDARQGVALIELLRQRYDVVLMNPPFGAGSLAAKGDFERSYPRTKNDLYAAFVERGIQLLHSHGLLGAITSRTGFFLSSFQQWREEILLKEAPPVVFADLGSGVLDTAMVEVAAYCVEKADEGAT